MNQNNVHCISLRSIIIKPILKKHADKLRFMVVGGANTAIDFGVLFILKNIGLSAIVGNYFSTTVALIFSFFANKTFTFKSDSKTSKVQFAKFLIITLVGLWIFQPIIIYGIQILLTDYNLDSNLVLFIGKIIATCFTLVWNYILYKKFVY